MHFPCILALAKYWGKGPNNKDEYGLLRRYVDELHSSNHGSTIKLEVVPSADLFVSIFKRLYICFDACKNVDLLLG